MRISLFLFIFCFSVIAQGTITDSKIYWAQFNTKANTPYSLNHPETYLSQRAIERRNMHGISIDSTDLPVNPTFIDSLKSLGFRVKHTSRWMNGAIVSLSDELDIESEVRPSFVSFYQIRKDIPLKSCINKFSDPDSDIQQYYGNSYRQISMLNGQILHQHVKGKGVVVAVIDAGFQNADQLDAFDSLFARNGVLGTYDFVNPGNNVYNEYHHGAAVLSVMAGNQPETLIGSAPDAEYWLLRSEDVNSEFPVEEDYWIIAAEFADSVGCDVINTSLGYTTFDNPIFDHTYAEFDGKTMRISKAANMAVDKGMVVVCSAGNSGNDAWGHIVAPSEAKNVLSIAAVNSAGDSVAFSSRGFTGEGALMKPDVAAMGAGVSFASSATNALVTGNGTSFSSPIIAGMAACLVELYPQKSATEIINLIRTLGDRYPSHDIKYGYGIPNFRLLFDTTTTITNQFSPTVLVTPNPFSSTLHIKHATNMTNFKLYSFSGEEILAMPLHGIYSEISSSSLSNLPKGVYFAVLSGTHEVKTIKLMKQ